MPPKPSFVVVEDPPVFDSIPFTWLVALMLLLLYNILRVACKPNYRC